MYCRPSTVDRTYAITAADHKCHIVYYCHLTTTTTRIYYYYPQTQNHHHHIPLKVRAGVASGSKASSTESSAGGALALGASLDPGSLASSSRLKRKQTLTRQHARGRYEGPELSQGSSLELEPDLTAAPGPPGFHRAGTKTPSSLNSQGHGKLCCSEITYTSVLTQTLVVLLLILVDMPERYHLFQNA